MKQAAAPPRKETAKDTANPAALVTARLERRRLAARLVLAFERLWPRLWPPLGLVGLFAAAALFGVVALLPPWPHLALLLLLVAGVAGLAVSAFRGFAFPSPAAADRRLEQTNGLEHRPLAALADRPATHGATTGLLWQAHRARMAAKLAHVRVGLPHPNLAATDRRALRAGLVVALVAGIGIAGPDSLPRLADAFTPGIPTGPAPPPPELAAWITPPAYTHLPPIFLKAPGGSLTVPAGSGLAVSLTGGRGTPRMVLADHAVPFQKLGPASFRATATLAGGGRLTLARGGERLAAWDIAVTAPTPPSVRFTAAPGADSRSTATRFPWAVRDAYGVVALTVELHLARRTTAPAIRVPIPLPATDTRAAGGTALADLTASPWAGLDVTARLLGRNGAGLTGESDTVHFRLPEIAFRNPLARALIAVRKHLVLEPDNRDSAIADLDRLAATPAAQNGDLGGFLNMRAIAFLLARDLAPAAIDRAENRLWELAWHYEAGPTERTARALAAATRALEQALAEAGRPGGPTTAEIDRRIRALQEAIRAQIAALAKSLRANSAKLPNTAGAQQLDQQAFDRMAEAMRQSVGSKDLATARAQMAELERLLQQLQNARPLNAEDVARAQQWQRGAQAMNALGDVVQREAGLLDRAEGRLAAPGKAEPGPDPAPAAAAGRRQDAAVQQALRRVLGVLMGNLSDATGKIPPALGKADIAMRGAVAALGAGADAKAAAAERQAIAELQQGGRQAMAAMAAGAGRNGMRGSGAAGFLMQGGPFSGNPLFGQFGQAPGIGLDPLGRPTGDQTDGGRANGFVAIPDRDVAAEARAIQEELRRRDANPALPVPDRDYIDRLLKEF
jgi:uncharacterized protein (TIGR02302 family)